MSDPGGRPATLQAKSIFILADRIFFQNGRSTDGLPASISHTKVKNINRSPQFISSHVVHR